MHGGLPPASVFPLSSLSFTCVDPLSAAKQFTGADVVPSEAASAPSDCSSPSTTALHASTGEALNITIDDPKAMETMQQYNLDFYGHPELRAWLRKLTYRLQAPTRDDLEVLMAAGCNGCLDKIMRMIADPGDSVLVEESMFSGVCFCFGHNWHNHLLYTEY